MNNTVYLVTRFDGDTYDYLSDGLVAIFSNMDAVEEFMKSNHATRSKVICTEFDSVWDVERPKCPKTGRVECLECPEYIEHRTEDVPCDAWEEFKLGRMSSNTWYTVEAEHVFNSNEEYESSWSGGYSC